MPIISDPELFMQIYETGATRADRPGKTPPNRRANNYAPGFQKRAASGDHRLSLVCQSIIEDQFGEDNARLVKSLSDHFKSNANWRQLSIIYRMDRYLNCQPELKGNLLDPPVTKREKL